MREENKWLKELKTRQVNHQSSFSSALISEGKLIEEEFQPLYHRQHPEMGKLHNDI